MFKKIFVSAILIALAVFNFTGCTSNRNYKPVATHSLYNQALSRAEVSSEKSSLPSSRGSQKIIDKALDLCQLSRKYWQRGELEKALDILDDAYSKILKLDDSKSSPKLIQQKEDLRFLISKRILEIYASRHTVVNGNHKAIPIILNKHVKREIARFTSNEKRFFIESYKRSGRYRNQMVEFLKEAGLPEELSWLPLIESGFKARALSKARALGLWQFIPSTGYKFGLSRDKFIDERLDPTKATKAAIAYLKELHKIFGDWATALASYNCGERRVLNIIRSQKINYLDNFWDLYQRLPRETARYVPRFLAALHIINNPKKYKIDKIQTDPPQFYEIVRINKQVHLKNVASKIGISQKTLASLNPELRYQILPPEPYSLKVPPGKKKKLLASLRNIPIAKVHSRSYAYHKVRRGETLSQIARRYRTSMRAIARTNRLRRNYLIVAGKTLKIPLNSSRSYANKGKSKYKSKKSRVQNRGQNRLVKYIVSKGDSLWNIARRHGTTTKKIKRLNKIRGTRIAIGQVLKIPG